MNLFAKMCRSIGGACISEIWIPLAPGMEIGYVVRDAKKEVDPERDNSNLMPDIMDPAGEGLGKVAFALQRV